MVTFFSLLVWLTPKIKCNFCTSFGVAKSSTKTAQKNHKRSTKFTSLFVISTTIWPFWCSCVFAGLLCLGKSWLELYSQKTSWVQLVSVLNVATSPLFVLFFEKIKQRRNKILLALVLNFPLKNFVTYNDLMTPAPFTFFFYIF